MPLLNWTLCLCHSQLKSVIADNLPSLSLSDLESPQPLSCVSSPSQPSEGESPTHTSCAGAMRRRHNPLVYSLSSGKPNIVLKSGFLIQETVYSISPSSLSTYYICLVSENEYELYKNTDIRPPFTYATLIRQVVFLLIFKHRIATYFLIPCSLPLSFIFCVC